MIYVKKINMFFLIIIGILVLGINVNAEGVEDDWLSTTTFVECEKDDIGRVTSGTYKFDVQNFSNNWYHCGYGFPSNSSGLYFVREINENATHSKISYTLYTIDGSIINGRLYNCDSRAPIDANAAEFNWNNFNRSVSGIISYDSGGFITDIPVFDSSNDNYEENVRKYKENGDVSGASNVMDLENEDPYDDDVELPKNFRTYGKISNGTITNTSLNQKLTCRWDTPDDSVLKEYSYDLRVKVTYLYSETDGIKTTDWKNFVAAYPYERGNLYDLNTGEQVERTSSVAEEYVIDSNEIISSFELKREFLNIKSITIQIRNRYNGHVSNWVQCESLASGYNSTTVRDNNGEYVEDDNYHGQDTSNNDNSKAYETDTGTDGSGNNISGNLPSVDNVNFNGIMAFVRDGFGLIGSGGIITLMSKTFLYLPNSIWTILKFFVSMLVICSVIKLIKEVIF